MIRPVALDEVLDRRSVATLPLLEGNVLAAVDAPTKLLGLDPCRVDRPDRPTADSVEALDAVDPVSEQE